jgi:hypothetical protein
MKEAESLGMIRENARLAVERDPIVANNTRAALFRKIAPLLRRSKRERLALRLEFERLRTEPTAAELVARGWAVEDALNRVDERAQEFERLLGFRF